LTIDCISGLTGASPDSRAALAAASNAGRVAPISGISAYTGHNKTLTKDGHEVVDAVGPDVLLLRPAIINLDVAAPDIMRASMGNTWVSSAGSMTLYMELYDSASSTIIGRVADPRADPNDGAQIANKVTNKVAADRIIRRWAELLSSHLGEVQQSTAP
jgi:hypothetical protein